MACITRTSCLSVWLIPFAFSVLAASAAEGQAADQTRRRIRFEAGGTGGYSRSWQDYGGSDDSLHVYGGPLGGVELGVKWSLGERVRLGFRLSGQVGPLSQPCASITCRAAWALNRDDELFRYNTTGDGGTGCVCRYQTGIAGVLTASGVLDVVLWKWMWLEFSSGFFVPIASDREPLPGLQGGIGVGFSILNERRVSPYLRFQGKGTWLDNVGVSALGALGIYF